MCVFDRERFIKLAAIRHTSLLIGRMALHLFVLRTCTYTNGKQKYQTIRTPSDVASAQPSIKRIT